jgi:hypothetical protein
MAAKQFRLAYVLFDSFQAMKLYYFIDFVVCRTAFACCCGRLFTSLGGLLPNPLPCLLAYDPVLVGPSLRKVWSKTRFSYASSPEHVLGNRTVWSYIKDTHICFISALSFTPGIHPFASLGANSRYLLRRERARGRKWMYCDVHTMHLNRSRCYDRV